MNLRKWLVCEIEGHRFELVVATFTEKLLLAKCGSCGAEISAKGPDAYDEVEREALRRGWAIGVRVRHGWREVREALWSAVRYSGLGFLLTLFRPWCWLVGHRFDAARFYSPGELHSCECSRCTLVCEETGNECWTRNRKRMEWLSRSLLGRVPIGTKSVLFGAHCFLYHPFAVAFGWWDIYRWQGPFDDSKWPALLDPRAWLVFVVHDLGYIGRPNMDGEEGEAHPYPAARFVSRILSRKKDRDTYIPMQTFGLKIEGGFWLCKWGMFTLCHSRHLVKVLNRYPRLGNLRPSRLCMADKMAPTYTPAWLYLPGARLSGELAEYMEHAREAGESVGVVATSPREWYDSMGRYCARWAREHADGREDQWTGDRRRGIGDNPSE